jgi:hypothetical protein
MGKLLRTAFGLPGKQTKELAKEKIPKLRRFDAFAERRSLVTKRIELDHYCSFVAQICAASQASSNSRNEHHAGLAEEIPCGQCEITCNAAFTALQPRSVETCFAVFVYSSSVPSPSHQIGASQLVISSSR